MSSADVLQHNGASAVAHGRPAIHVASIDELVGAHPDTLRSVYGRGKPCDPAELGDRPTGRLLTLEMGSEAFMVLRPLVRALAGGLSPWQGKVFDHGGNAGQNVVFGRHVARFRTERAESLIDGEPTLALLYDSPAFGNPWPLRAVRDELRSVAPGIAIGPAIFPLGGTPRVVLWFGLGVR
ncbi:MAG: hypothetical protein WKG00_31250 [Polyangiaceae bacterium]